MCTERRTADEVKKRADEIYRQISLQIETKDNIGKIILIDTESGEYSIAENSLAANKSLRSKHPKAQPDALYAMRIGYDAVYTFHEALSGSKS